MPLGDNEQPFARLGKSLALPQTATLALKGPQIVPLLDEHEREWWSETDMLGMGKYLLASNLALVADRSLHAEQGCQTQIRDSR